MKLDKLLRRRIFDVRILNSKMQTPSIKEVLDEWFDSINFFNNRSRLIPFATMSFHFLTLIALIIYVSGYLSFPTILYLMESVLFLGIVYNTIWLHRYCSHVSFAFSKRHFAMILFWLNPIFFMEEHYALPHRVHHSYPESALDPYGPHLGWLGSYFAIPSINTEISFEDFKSVKKSLMHIPISFNRYDQFKKYGCFEKPSLFFLRMLFAQTFWLLFSFVLGGMPFVFAWYSAVFVIVYLIRDFNWWGHGGNFRHWKKIGWEFDSKSSALNQYFYGYIAGEWHDNHHVFPMSTNTGFLRGQFDLAYLIIKILHRFKIVKSFFDAKKIFHETVLTKNKL